MHFDNKSDNAKQKNVHKRCIMLGMTQHSARAGRVITMEEPNLPEVTSQTDKMLVRNVIYAIWSLNVNSAEPCIGWQVQVKAYGYLVVVSFPQTFSLSATDMRLISDVNLLRIESITVRNPENAISENMSGAKASADGTTRVGAIMVVKILNENQPVTITDAEIVLVKKRKRGFLGL